VRSGLGNVFGPVRPSWVAHGPGSDSNASYGSRGRSVKGNRVRIVRLYCPLDRSPDCEEPWKCAAHYPHPYAITPEKQIYPHAFEKRHIGMPQSTGRARRDPLRHGIAPCSGWDGSQGAPGGSQSKARPRLPFSRRVHPVGGRLRALHPLTRRLNLRFKGGPQPRQLDRLVGRLQPSERQHRGYGTSSYGHLDFRRKTTIH
jgi:hypothetical protein